MSENIEGSSVTITEIMDFLPHRYPFLLVDRVVEMNGEQSGVGIKNVTASEPWFTGHFPENPVFPGVLIIEAIAQVSAILVLQHAKDSGNPMETKLIYFMTVDKVRFRHPVTPGGFELMGIDVKRCDTPQDVAPTVDAALYAAFASEQKIAILLSQRLIGRKEW